jgi:hypothetical protein
VNARSGTDAAGRLAPEAPTNLEVFSPRGHDEKRKEPIGLGKRTLVATVYLGGCATDTGHCSAPQRAREVRGRTLGPVGFPPEQPRVEAHGRVRVRPPRVDPARNADFVSDALGHLEARSGLGIAREPVGHAP